MAQLAMVAWAFAFAAGDWPVRLVLAGMLVDLVLLPFHQAGLARLQRAGLRRNVDRDGVRLEGAAQRYGSSHAPST